MQEDILGTGEELGELIGTCSVCGRPYPLTQLQPHEGLGLTRFLPEQEDICPECAAHVDAVEEEGVPLDSVDVDDQE